MSSESSSRRSSLRRLSSMASLQALNPFTRRRSNQTDASIATSSTLSLASTAQNKLSASSSQIFPSYDIDEMDEGGASIPPVPSYSRKSSYICLPDDPIRGMPRSQTFSNLPLPTKARRSTMSTSKSHSRLPSTVYPSNAPSLLSHTRIPTPPTSTRKHSISHITPVNRMKRSDTKPLLQYDVGRSTAFKENISPSPPKTYHLQKNVPDFLPSHDPRAHKLSQSSPAHRSSINRVATPMSTSMRPDGMQRWHSQPVIRNIDTHLPSAIVNSHQLFDMTNSQQLSGVTNHPHRHSSPVKDSRRVSSITDRRHSRHGEIQERRLIGEVKPEIMPSPKTPLTAVNNSSRRSVIHSSQLRQVSEPSPDQTSSQPKDGSPFRPCANHIHVAEPIAYWCGRFSTLNDRYRNEELLTAVGSPKQDSDKVHNQDANNRRMRRALEYLHGLCATSEAQESFVLFQLQLAALHKNQDLGRPIGRGSGLEKLIVLSRLEEGDESERGSTTMDSSPSEARKKSLMHRILGRGKGDRRSLVN